MDQFDFEILVAHAADQAAVSKLRKEVYSEQFGDALELAGLNWNEFDSRGAVLIAKPANMLPKSDPQSIVATMRVILLDNSVDFEKVMTFPPQTANVALPIVAINRIATEASFRSLGIIGRMREIAIQLADFSGANCVLGSSESDSPHFAQLAEIGYDITILQSNWNGFLKSTKPIALGSLPRDRFASATEKLRTKFSHSNLSQKVGFKMSVDLKATVRHLLA